MYEIVQKWVCKDHTKIVTSKVNGLEIVHRAWEERVNQESA